MTIALLVALLGVSHALSLTTVAPQSSTVVATSTAAAQTTASAATSAPPGTTSAATGAPTTTAPAGPTYLTYGNPFACTSYDVVRVQYPSTLDDQTYMGVAAAARYGDFTAFCLDVHVVSGFTTPYSYDQALTNLVANASDLAFADGASLLSALSQTPPAPIVGLLQLFQKSTFVGVSTTNPALTWSAVQSGNFTSAPVRVNGGRLSAALAGSGVSTTQENLNAEFSELQGNAQVLLYEMRTFDGVARLRVTAKGKPVNGTQPLYGLSDFALLDPSQTGAAFMEEVLVARNDFLAANAGVVARFIAALASGYARVRDNPDAAATMAYTLGAGDDQFDVGVGYVGAVYLGDAVFSGGAPFGTVDMTLLAQTRLLANKYLPGYSIPPQALNGAFNVAPLASALALLAAMTPIDATSAGMSNTALKLTWYADRGYAGKAGLRPSIPTYSVPPLPTMYVHAAGAGLTPGYIALIVILIIVAIALAVIGLVYVLWRRRRALHAEELIEQQVDALVLAKADEDAALKKIGTSDEVVIEFEGKKTTSGGAPLMVDFEVSNQRTSKPTFSVAPGSRMPIDHVLLDVMTLLNNSEHKLYYRIYVPQTTAFSLTARPGVGVIEPQKFVEVRLLLKLLYTLTQRRVFRIDVSDRDGESAPVIGSVLVPLNIVGDVSTRLSPADIELSSGKQVSETDTTITYRGTYRGTVVAVRVIRRQTELTDQQMAAFEKEVELYEKLRSPYVVNFIGASHEKGKLCLCSEWLDRGTVEDLVLQHGKEVSLPLKYKFMLDAAMAVAFLHENGVLHRNLKLNVLLVFSVSVAANVNCKLSDFSLARSVVDVNVPGQYSAGVSVPIFMAPEVMAGQKYCAKADVYSLGLIMWSLLAEALPFSEITAIWNLSPKVIDEAYRPKIDEKWNTSIKTLIKDCWHPSPQRRPTTADLVVSLKNIASKVKRDHVRARRANVSSQSGAASSPRDKSVTLELTEPDADGEKPKSSERRSERHSERRSRRRDDADAEKKPSSSSSGRKHRSSSRDKKKKKEDDPKGDE